MTNKQITHVAIKLQKGEISSIFAAPRPHRHHNIFRAFSVVMMDLRSAGFEEVQGFLLDHNQFINRSEAYKIACENGQLKTRNGNGDYDQPELFSEDLW